MACSAVVIQHSALGTKASLGRGEAVAEHPSGAAALVLGSIFAALSPWLDAEAQKYPESTGQMASWFSVSSQVQWF